MVLPLHDNPSSTALIYGFVGFVLPMLMFIAWFEQAKSRRRKIFALVLGMLVSTVIARHFADIQVSVVLTENGFTVNKSLTPADQFRSEDIIRVEEKILRVDTVLVITERSGHFYTIDAPDDRRAKVGQAIASNVGLTQAGWNGEHPVWRRPAQ